MKSIFESLQGDLSLLYTLATYAFALIGVWMVAHGLLGLYRISQSNSSDRSPARAYIIALFVGGALTSINVVAGIFKATVLGVGG